MSSSTKNNATSGSDIEIKKFDWSLALNTISNQKDLTEKQAADAMRNLLSGNANETQISAFLMGLKTKGESVAEILGFVASMVNEAKSITLDPGVIDIVGTGGTTQGKSSALNTSTMASFLVAASGVPVCKHGNRKATSTSGSFDFLESLGIRIDLEPYEVEQSVRQHNLGFVFAKSFHPAMRFAGPIRKSLGIPTIFNLIGPISHPGNVSNIVLGTSDFEVSKKLAEVLKARSMNAWVVTGEDGLDELTLSGTTHVLKVEKEEISYCEITPEDAGLTINTDQILGGSAQDNVEIFNSILSGENSPQRDLVIFNAAAALVVADSSKTLSEGVEEIDSLIESGKVSQFMRDFRSNH